MLVPVGPHLAHEVETARATDPVRSGKERLRRVNCAIVDPIRQFVGPGGRNEIKPTFVSFGAPNFAGKCDEFANFGGGAAVYQELERDSGIENLAGPLIERSWIVFKRQCNQCVGCSLDITRVRRL